MVRCIHYVNTFFESVGTSIFHNVQQQPLPQCLVWKTIFFAFNLCLINSLALVFLEIMNNHCLFSFSALIKSWNSMPQDLVKSECLFGFKERLDKVIEDNYICRTHLQLKKPWAAIIAASGSSKKNIAYTNSDLITGHYFWSKTGYCFRWAFGMTHCSWSYILTHDLISPSSLFKHTTQIFS